MTSQKCKNENLMTSQKSKTENLMTSHFGTLFADRAYK